MAALAMCAVGTAVSMILGRFGVAGLFIAAIIALRLLGLGSWDADDDD
jgi:hypothetical protein